MAEPTRRVRSRTGALALAAAVVMAGAVAPTASAELTPTITAAVDEDMINGWFFTPGSSVRGRVFDSAGGSVVQEFTAATDESEGKFKADPWTSVDLTVGMYVEVEDVTTGITKSLTLTGLTFETLDLDANTAAGHAPPASRLRLEGATDTDPVLPPGPVQYSVDVIADGSGAWSVDLLAEHGVDLQQINTAEVQLVDEDGDSTRAAFHHSDFTANPGTDNISSASFDIGSMHGWWDPESTVDIQIHRADGELIYRGSAATDRRGSFDLDYRQHGVNLHPGMHIQVADSDDTLSYTVAALTWDTLNPRTDTATGRIPAGITWVMGCIAFDEPEGKVGKGGWIVNEDGDTHWATGFAPEGDVLPDSWGEVAVPGTIASYVPPEQAIAQLKDLVTFLVDRHEIPRAQGRLLAAQLTTALRLASSGRDRAAATTLQAFTRTVDRLARRGVVSTDRAGKLTDDTHATVTALKGR